MPRSCLVLFSGGLDSILACKVLQKQGIMVRGLKFISPFFSYDLSDEQKQSSYKEKIFQKHGIPVEVVDITQDYLKMVVAPKHGYGRYANPCVDCKILMVRKAINLLNEFGASFIATGEVLGQRPMSQRRDTLRIIERDSGADGILLRPLSAKLLAETKPENAGIVDRSMLLAITGRSRKEQIRLARHFGITDYPAPAGGCVLADPILSKRFKKIFSMWPEFDASDCILAQTGRHFLMPGGAWLVVGRNKAENETMETLVKDGDILLKAKTCPGPLCILRRNKEGSDLVFAARICARYAKVAKLPVEIEARYKDGAICQKVQVQDIPHDIEIRGLMF